ncbi:SOS response-associated peptidase family protein [Aquicoccus sp. G2-2]|uniref:SOS response-associated peptidase family protein n=1 Tax=Aquicoccus sp. G2-2 TaxID=3092120 RepID=UPI002AE038EA|nr:SOS response-associated peptidase family protein [Aquicoccus sp. G2-2]MEA1115058.1 SOS response-associated peptidase family protein [Aquicoccus sp. G2-2]
MGPFTISGAGWPERTETYSMITTTANSLMLPVHPTRVPVIMPADLAQNSYAQWLDGTPADAKALLRPYPAEAMQLRKAGENEKTGRV